MIKSRTVYLKKAKSPQKLNWRIAFDVSELCMIWYQTYCNIFSLFFRGSLSNIHTGLNRGRASSLNPNSIRGYHQLPHLHNKLLQPAVGQSPSKQLLSSTTPDFSQEQLRRQHHPSCRDASLGRQHQASLPFLKTIRAKRQALTAKPHRYHTISNAVNICLLQVPNLGLLWLLSPQTILIERGL